MLYIGRTNSLSPHISDILKSFQHDILCSIFDMTKKPDNIFDIKTKLHALYAMVIPVDECDSIYLDAKLNYMEAALKFDFINIHQGLPILNKP